MRLRKASLRRGVTLVDIMGGVSVLAVTVISALAMFPVSNLLRDRTGNNTRAATIMQRKLDQIRAIKAADLTASKLRALGIVDPGTSSTLTFTQVDNLSNELLGASGTVAITNPGTDLVHAQVTLTWTGMKGQSNTATAFTFVSDKTAWREP